MISILCHKWHKMSPILTKEEFLFQTWQSYLGINFDKKQFWLPISQKKLIQISQQKDFCNLIQEIKTLFRWANGKGWEITDAFCQKMGYFCETHYQSGIFIWEFGSLQ